MKKGEIIEILIEDIAFPSKPYGYYENREQKVFANINCVPGQKVRGTIGKIKNRKIELRNIEIIENAPSNIEPFCDKFNKCGGCTYQYLSYEEQLYLKSQQIYKMLKNSIRYDFLFEESVRTPLEKEYRNKMEFTFGNEILDGPLILGLHKKNSFHDIVPVSNCLLMDGNFRKIFVYTQDFFVERDISFYHRIKHIGFLRNLVIRKGEKTKEISVNLITSSQIDYIDLINDWMDGLLKLDLSSNIVSIIHTINDNFSDSVKSDLERIIYGTRDINEKIFDLNFKISPYSFFQTNSFGVEKLYSKVIDYLKEIKSEGKEGIVFDLFSGTGTIGQIVSKEAKQVYGIEIVEEAVKKANENAKINNITNAEFIAGDVFVKLSELDERGIKPDILILDPPRAGVGEKTVRKLVEYDVDSIIYVSCNPKTLADDLKIFEECKYYLEKVCCVDMFAYTPHMETVTLLKKRDDVQFEDYKN